MLDNYDRGEVTPPPVSSYGGSPGLLALHSSLYATPTSRAYDIESNIDGNDSSMPIDTQIISVRFRSGRSSTQAGETVPFENSLAYFSFKERCFTSNVTPAHLRSRYFIAFLALSQLHAAVYCFVDNVDSRSSKLCN